MEKVTESAIINKKKELNIVVISNCSYINVREIT